MEGDTFYVIGYCNAQKHFKYKTLIFELKLILRGNLEVVINWAATAHRLTLTFREKQKQMSRNILTGINKLLNIFIHLCLFVFS